MSYPADLTKSAFILARSCPNKLFYLANGYPSANDGNEYFELLKDGGYVIGKMAQLLYPDGIPVDGLAEGIDPEEQTRKLLGGDSATVFEATLRSRGKRVAVDILLKNAMRIDLIEVKSKSFDSTEHQKLIAERGFGIFRGAKGKLSTDWQPYIEDVAFQTLVVRECFPGVEVRSFLLMPDKAKTTAIDGLSGWFRIDKSAAAHGKGTFSVSFTGDAEALRRDHFLSLVDVTSEVDQLLPEVALAAEQFIAILAEGRRAVIPIGKHCKDCEYNVPFRDSKGGYAECWGALADPSPHIFDLYHCTTIKADGAFVIDRLIEEQRTSLFDMPLELLSGKRGERQRVQIFYTRNQKEWIDEPLAAFIQSVRYPLHFIDFETTKSGVPPHAGMRPFEDVAFQWSCHSLDEPGGTPRHSEWINCEAGFPNFRFAESLREQIGDTGTIFTWASHENTILKSVLLQMAVYRYENPALRDWLTMVVTGATTQGRLVDMCRLTHEHYFHPAMKGKVSLKAVLPAIWESNAELREHAWCKQYVRFDGEVLLNPYKVLPELEIGGCATAVREGTAAIVAYEEMLSGLREDDKPRQEKWKKLLLQYCELDTLAMVIVWHHWVMKCSR